MDRTGFIGSSDAAAILGISPWKTPLQLYLEKIGEAPKETEEQNLKAKTRGKRLEPYIMDMLREEHGLRIVGRNVIHHDAELPYIRAEIDAECAIEGPETREFSRGSIEAKTVHPFKVKEWGDQDTDQIPVHYTAQAMHGIMVTGRDHTLFAVLIGDDLRLYRVERDPAIIIGLRQKEIDFWNNHVLARVPPPPTTVKDVLHLFKSDLGTIAEADDAIYAAIERMREIEPMRKEYEKLKERIEVFMGAAATLTREGEILATWRSQSSRRFDQAAFAADHPELVEQFKRTSVSRVFRLK
jgi:putative phage-type endonuclease